MPSFMIIFITKARGNVIVFRGRTPIPLRKQTNIQIIKLILKYIVARNIVNLSFETTTHSTDCNILSIGYLVCWAIIICFNDFRDKSCQP